MTEAQLEKISLDWFRETGWHTAHGSTIAPDGVNSQRENFSETILKCDLRSVFTRINPHLPEKHIDSCFEQVISTLNKPECMDLITNNHTFHRFLLTGIPVQYRVMNERKHDELKKDQAFLVDFENFENNHFIAINQVDIAGIKQMYRANIVCFVNGLPLAVIELESSDDNITDIPSLSDMGAAFYQLQTYKDDIPNLLVFNEVLVISDGHNARVGSLSASEERFIPWRILGQKATQVEWQLKTVVCDSFDRKRFLDYIRFFVVFENDGGFIIKKIATSYQVHAVQAAIQTTIIAAQEKQEETDTIQDAHKTRKIRAGNKKAGVVWHTQGSGKSFSICCYAGKLFKQPAMNNPTIVIVTNSSDLDSQLFSTFSNATELLGQTPVQADDRQTLRQLLAERGSGGIIFTTVQKFTLLAGETMHPVLNDRHNIVIISDEAHRNQYEIPSSAKTNDIHKSSHSRYLRDALPYASFLGFTGTPISQEDRDTRAIFGEYVSIYDIQDAIDDKATVNIYYESRLPQLDINHAEIKVLSDQAEDLIEDEEDTIKREMNKNGWIELEKLVGTTARVQQVAKDLITHFENRSTFVTGKAMIVAMSRNICAQLYNEIIALREDWHDPDPEKGTIKIIMTASASNIEILQPHIYNKETKKRLASRFKDASDPLKLVIVRDMWLTGFDVPCCHTMYVDKPMKGHTLMQAIARVNRVYKDKEDGLIVDYIGISNELQSAHKTYADSDGKGLPTLEIKEAIKALQKRVTALRNLFVKTPQSEGLNLSTFSIKPLPLILIATNYVLGLQDGKNRFSDAVVAVTKTYSLCSAMMEIKTFHKELAFYSAIKASINKLSETDSKNIETAEKSILKQIVDDTIVPDGVVDFFDLCGIKRTHTELLSAEFLEEVRQLPTRNIAIELLVRRIKDEMQAREYNNIVQEKKYEDFLKEILSKYNKRSIEVTQTIDDLINLAKEFQEELRHESELGINPEETVFYTALANNESVVRYLGDEILKKIAMELSEKLRKSATVDWQVRDNVRAELRILVRRTLQRWKYPPDEIANAVDLVLEQAEVVSNYWTV